MNKIEEQFGTADNLAPEKRLGILKDKLSEWIGDSDYDSEELDRKRGFLDNKKAMLIEHFGPKARTYKTYFILLGESAPDNAINFDFPGEHSIESWVNKITFSC